MNQFDELKAMVIHDQTVSEGYAYSGLQMHSMASNFFKESVDISKGFDYHYAYTKAEGEELLCFYFVAVLQSRFIASLGVNNLGQESIIDEVLDGVYVWERKLADKIVARQAKKPIHHRWLH